MTASPLRESRFPVGSSASRMSGSPATARANRDALLLTAESWLGRSWPGAPSDALERPLRRAAWRRRLHPAIGERQLDVLEGPSGRQSG